MSAALGHPIWQSNRQDGQTGEPLLDRSPRLGARARRPDPLDHADRPPEPVTSTLLSQPARTSRCDESAAALPEVSSRHFRGYRVAPWIFQSCWSLMLPNGGPGCAASGSSRKECGSSLQRRARHTQQRSPTTKHSTRRSALAGSTGSSGVVTAQRSGGDSHPEALGALGRNGTSPLPSGCAPPVGWIDQGKTRFGGRKPMGDGPAPTPDKPPWKFRRILRKPWLPIPQLERCFAISRVRTGTQSSIGSEAQRRLRPEPDASRSS